MRKVGFGIIGCGMIANWHADAITKVDGARLVGAVDVNIEAGKAFAEKYETRAFETIEKLLQNKDIKIVCICTPSGLHASLAVKAAGAGKHIVVEKPMAITLKECDEIIKACEKNNVKLAVISQLRFSHSVRELKKAIVSQKLGRLVSGDVYMKYFRSEEYYEKSGWKGTWKMDGGGALMNQGIHGVDLLQYVMGPVKLVFGHARTLTRNIEVEDTATAVLEFENGALGVIQGTTSVYPGSPRRLEVNGDKGTIVLEEDSIALWEIKGEQIPDNIETGSTRVSTASNPAALGIEGHMLQISDMVDAVIDNRKPMVDQYEGRKPVEIITAIYESSRSGKPVYLKK